VKLIIENFVSFILNTIALAVSTKVSFLASKAVEYQ